LKTLGIDLSADPSRTGACAVDWSSGTVWLMGPPATDDALVAVAVSCDMTAVDVPLGWPDGFVDAVVAHHQGAGWPPWSVAPPLDRLPLRYRLTDRVVMAGGGRPLSVSSDLIGVAAMRGARLQHLLVSAGVPVDRSGVTGRVVEAYPAAALRAWGMASSRYKGRLHVAACGSLVAELTARCGAVGRAAAAALEGCDDNALDAFVCALVARAALMGLTTRPAEEQVEVARREGWIHVPTAGVAEIVGARRRLR
jgi:predicted nuclease with RNAse H fold